MTKLRLWWIVLVAFFPMFASCSGDPFTLAIDDFNDRGPQRPAVIQISDPQVFRRETLVNDRLEEAKLINQLLVKTLEPDFAAKNFQPQLKRDVEAITALAAQLAVSFDAGLKTQTQQQEELNDLDFELETLNKKVAREQKRQELKRAEAGLTTNTTDQSETTASQPTTTANAAPPSEDAPPAEPSESEDDGADTPPDGSGSEATTKLEELQQKRPGKTK